MSFERKLEPNLFELQSQLRHGRYRHGSYQAFAIHDPKPRRIHKAAVRDRVVHQALVSLLEPIFEPIFIFDSFSCRKGKGTHAAVRRLRQLLGRASEGGHRTVYALKCDIQSFFASVDHQLLESFLRRRVSDEDVIELFHRIISSYQTTRGKGIPLGNLTSQLFANVYLHEFDRFVKHELREPHYLRYCDDFIVLSPSRSHLDLELLYVDFGSAEDNLELYWKAIAASQPNAWRYDGLKSDPEHLRLGPGARSYEFGVHRIRVNLVAHWDPENGRSVQEVRERVAPTGETLAHAEALCAYALHDELFQQMDGENLPYADLAGYEATVYSGNPWQDVPCLHRDSVDREAELSADWDGRSYSSWSAPVVLRES